MVSANEMQTPLKRILLQLALGCLFASVLAKNSKSIGGKSPAFSDFDRRAQAGERLNVVFFGASLTWGANASDPMQTSYRALIAKRLEEKYPEAHFKFHDAAIGGTGSQLGVFRLGRDVLKRNPDLVFLDFSANDGMTTADTETLASYESIVRRLISEGKVPVVQVAFPFLWNVKYGTMESFKRLAAHREISAAYQTAFGDAVSLCKERIKSGETTFERIWPFDGVHPGNDGYGVFADAAWSAFEKAVREKRECRMPAKMLHGHSYMISKRFRISSLKPLPKGWTVKVPNPVSAHFDMLMSRWLDDEVVASSKKDQIPNIQPIKVKFSGSMLMLFGESTEKSVKYRVLIDGKVIEREVQEGKKKVNLKEFNAAELASVVKGNCHHAQLIATGLDPKIEHTLEIHPLFVGKADEEIRLESICVAGGKAEVYR